MARYDKDKVIGKGSFGQVWLVKSKLSRHSYVLKEIDLNVLSVAEQQQALKESDILKRCKHEHIIRYKETVLDQNKNLLSIIMEYAEGGDLSQAILKRKGVPFTEHRVIAWFTQICLALQYIHHQNILHRDLKTQNIFLGRNKMIKIGDFGISRVLGRDDLANTIIGTPYYLSPEICQKRPYNHKSDIWALGCILYELVTLEHAFEATNFVHLQFLVQNGTRGKLPSDCNPFIVRLIDSLLNIDPKERPCTTEILTDPVLQPYLSEYLAIQNGNCFPIPADINETTSRRNSSGDILKTKIPLKRKNSLPSMNPRPAKHGTNTVLKKAMKVKTSQFVNGRPCSSKTFQKISSMTSTGKSGKEPTNKMSKVGFALHVTKESGLTRSCDTYVMDACPHTENDKISNFTKSEDFSLNGDYGYYTKEGMCNDELLNADSSGNCPLENMDLGDSTENVLFQSTKCLNVSHNDGRQLSPHKYIHGRCPHSQCHHCMLDTLWENRIRGVGTVVDTEERTRLKNKLFAVYRDGRFSEVYNYLASGWDGTDSIASKIRLQKVMSILTYEQVQSLPLMMQLIQLDLLVKSRQN